MKNPPTLIWQGEVVGHGTVRVCIDKSDVLCVERMERDAMDEETWVHIHIDTDCWRKALSLAIRSMVAGKEGA